MDRFLNGSSYKWILLAITALFVLLRIIYPSSDPPIMLGGSSGAWHDEGTYTLNARNRVLFGKWSLDEYDFFVWLAPVTNLLYFSAFSMFGAGLVQARLVSVFLSIVSLAIFYKCCEKNLGRRGAFFSTSLLGFNYLFIVYNRIATGRMTGIFFAILAIYLLTKGVEERKKKFLFLAGVVAFLTFSERASMGLFIILIPASLCFVNLKKNIRLKLILHIVAGEVFTALVWLLIIAIPQYGHCRNFLSIVSSQIRPSSVSAAISNIWREPSAAYFTDMMPVIWVAACVYVFYVLRQFKKVNGLMFLSAIWFVSGIAFLSCLNPRPIRFYAYLVPPMCILSGDAIRKLLEPKWEPEHKERCGLLCSVVVSLILLLHLSLITKNFLKLAPVSSFLGLSSVSSENSLVLSIILAIFAMPFIYLLFRTKIVVPKIVLKFTGVTLFGLSLVLNGYKYYNTMKNPGYTRKIISEDLGKALNRASIAGMWAPAICLHNNHKAHVSWYGINDEEDFFEKYGITHVFCTIYNRENRYYREHFPNVFQRVTLLARYKLWRTEARLYEVTERGKEIDSALSIYEAEVLYRKTGMVRFDSQASRKFAVFADARVDEEGHLVFGPYVAYPKGGYKAIFRIRTCDRTDKVVATIDVATDKGTRIISKKNIHGIEFEKENLYEEFDLEYSLEDRERLEFRVYFHGEASLWIDNIKVYIGENSSR